MITELKKISEFFKNEDYKFLSLDYIYIHEKDGYPLQNEMNLENFFFVTEVLDDKIIVMGIVNSEEKEFVFSDFKDNWWFIRIPEEIRKKLF